MNALLIFVLLLLLVGVVLLWLGQRARQQTGLPAGEVIYSDTGAEEAVVEPLMSRRYGLVGKPDYLVHYTVEGRKVTAPVEVKSRKRPAALPESHILQLGVYCLLVEEKFGVKPPFGLLRYRDATLQIPFTDELRYRVLAAADAIRRDRTAQAVHRQHQEPERCRNCGYRHACGEEL